MTLLTLPLASACALTAQIISSRQPLPARVLLTPMTKSPPPPAAEPLAAGSVGGVDRGVPPKPVVSESARSAAAATPAVAPLR